MPEPTKPNDTQVGGAHYRSGFQHWDLMIAWDVHYLLAASTKYVCRWRQKGGYQDLEKALHYLNKMIEAVEAGKLKPHYENWNRNGILYKPNIEMTLAWELFQKNNQMDRELFDFTLKCIWWEDVNQLYQAKAVLVEYMELQKEEIPRYDRGQSIDIDPPELA